MLELGYGKENIWEPDKLTDMDIAIYAGRAVRGEFEERDYLVIFKTEPYIDSILVHLRAERSGSGESFEYLGRFTFRPDYAWDEETERQFSQLCREPNSCGYSYAAVEEIYKYYSAKFTDWKLQRYYTKPLRLLDHIYHCMQKSTAKEMLYKAGLDELAANLEDLDEYDLLATKPSELYEGISVRTLRAVNCREGSRLLATAYNRQMMKELQEKFPEAFRTKLNDCQCSYLNHLITGELTVGETGRLYMARRKQLQQLWNNSQFRLFLLKEKDKEEAAETIRELAKIDPLYKKCLSVNPDSPQAADYRIKQLKLYLLAQQEDFNKVIRRANRKRNEDWQERQDGYIVRYPQTINDFCREAVYMSNCLLTYVDAMSAGVTTILFLRKEEEPNQPYITIEIFGNELMQAYHRFNEDCTPEEANWIRRYCKRHGIGTGKFRFDHNVDQLF